jgi:DNA repair exonuclease SbcCD nuclease subunit
MRFSFLHAADLHLGSPFQGLSLRDPRLAERFGAASREAFEALIDRALEERVAFAIFAGDIFDGEWRDASAALFFNRQIARLTREGVKVYLLKGNHDAESVVTKSLSLPDAAHEFPARKARTFLIEELRVALHGRSFADRAESGNFAVDYPEPKPGWLNIGVLHSSLDGRPGHANYAPCALTDLRAKNYDYWALGHVHAHEIVCENPFVVYPGNLQGRSIRECGEKGAVLVDVEDGAVKGLRRLIVDRARFAEILIDASGLETPAELLREISARAREEIEGAAGRFLAARLRVQGASALHPQLAADPSGWREQVEAALHHAGDTIELEKFLVETRAPKQKDGAAKGDSELDFAALLDEVLADQAFAEEARAAISVIEAKMPPKSELPRENFEALLGEARDLALARAERSA